MNHCSLGRDEIADDLALGVAKCRVEFWRTSRTTIVASSSRCPNRNMIEPVRFAGRWENRSPNLRESIRSVGRLHPPARSIRNYANPFSIADVIGDTSTRTALDPALCWTNRSYPIPFVQLVVNEISSIDSLPQEWESARAELGNDVTLARL
jgi:hypothetical protein